MGLYQKYRPSSLDEMQGNKEIISTLSAMLSDLKTCPHAFLLTGPTGCGKTTLGRIIKDRLGCIGSDYIEVDSADYRGIDSVREIRKTAQYKPIETNSFCRVWLLDEVHKMTNDAQNALLKILEDAPTHVYFILCTTDPQKLIPTIKGRCSLFQVKQLSDSDMYTLLKRIVRTEGQRLDKEILSQIVQDSLGHPRNAIQILEQVLLVDPDTRLQVAKRSAEQQNQVIELCRALLGRKTWKEVANVLTGLKTEEPENIRRAVLGYCQAVLLKGNNDRAGAIMEAFIEPFYNSLYPGLVFACYSVVVNS